MPKQYLRQHGSRRTSQSEAMREDQVENSAGGFVWEVSDWEKLRRFLILGTEGGSYYASERKLTTSNIKALRACVLEDGVKAVNEIVEISHSGRAPKNDQALYALAYAISHGDKMTKRAAAEALPKVARIATHLYDFVTYAEGMRGWGRTMRWAVSNWYDRNPHQLAYQAIKYRTRNGWSHRDLLRLAHPKTDSAETARLFSWIAAQNPVGEEVRGAPESEMDQLVIGYAMAQNASSPQDTANYVRNFGLPREALNTEHLNDKVVWEALIETGMPMTAMIRNLATMTRNGVLDSREHKQAVLDQIGTEEAIRKARVHPLTVLIAQRTYGSGRGFRGTNTWTPIPDIIDALDEAFYLAFGNVEPTGKRILLALDVSGSMTGGQVAGAPLSPREAAAAMALVTLQVEKDVEVVGFYSGSGGYASIQRSVWGGQSGLTPIALSRRQRLDDAVRMTSGLPFGGTDCALPFIYAAQFEKDFDGFVVYTDSETWAGAIHPKQALDEYRQRSGINARSVVVGMVSNGFSIADPTDSGMLDVVGFDTAAPNLISEFIAGKL